MSFVTRSTITETFLERARTTPNALGFQYKADNAWKQATFREFHDDCRLVSYGLMGLGLKPGERAAILSHTRYEWSLCDLAILGARAVTVPIYPSNTAGDVAYILDHSEASVAILEDAVQLQKILDARLQKRDALPFLKKVVVIDPTAMRIADKDVLTLHALFELGRREEAREPTRFERNLLEAKPEDPMTICYTSGTTGMPKGAIITHDNLMSVLQDAVATFGEYIRPEGETILSFLPFSHILGKVESLAAHTFGWRQAFAESIEKLMTNLTEVRPTLIFAVPRIFEKANARIHEFVDEGSMIQRGLFQWALEAGQEHFSETDRGRIMAARNSLRYSAAKAIVFGKISERFGGRLRYAVCGGAPLAKDIASFFQIVGLEILEGYGLTETCGPITLNTPEHTRYGTVGRPLPEVSLKIAEDGEILVKSRKVFKGYYKLPRETEEAFTDGGWFRTGDIGHLDSSGYLCITDRKKDLIITSAGKNVAPQKIENLAKSFPYISQFVVLGDRRHYLTALVTLDREYVIRYASESQILFSEYSELIKNSKIIHMVQRAVDQINKSLASYETIKKFVILPNEFTVESGELTPSHKIRRNFVLRRYHDEVDSMYA